MAQKKEKRQGPKSMRIKTGHLRQRGQKSCLNHLDKRARGGGAAGETSEMGPAKAIFRLARKKNETTLVRQGKRKNRKGGEKVKSKKAIYQGEPLSTLKVFHIKFA